MSTGVCSAGFVVAMMDCRRAAIRSSRYCVNNGEGGDKSRAE